MAYSTTRRERVLGWTFCSYWPGASMSLRMFPSWNSPHVPRAFTLPSIFEKVVTLACNAPMPPCSGSSLERRVRTSSSRTATLPKSAWKRASTALPTCVGTCSETSVRISPNCPRTSSRCALSFAAERL